MLPLVLLEACVFLYERDNTGELRIVDDSGFIERTHILPWSKRGGLSKGQREQVAGILSSIANNAPAGWLLRFDTQRRQWQMNVKGYKDAEAAKNAVALYGDLP